jgi:uncharacterized DUF497 family protein
MGTRTVAGQRFSWDDTKRKKVKKDHGLDLAELPEAFGRPTVEIEAQSDEMDGLRFKMLALAERQIVVVVVYAENEDTGDIRLITAWPANKIEQSLYYSQIFGESY